MSDEDYVELSDGRRAPLLRPGIDFPITPTLTECLLGLIDDHTPGTIDSPPPCDDPLCECQMYIIRRICRALEAAGRLPESYRQVVDGPTVP